jgi:YD repeat-containing protein
MIITAHILEKSGACEAAVKFVERNFPDGFGPDHIRADGSMRDWYEWLRCREYDSRGNKTKETSPGGDVCLYEYDSRGNQTKVTYPGGRVCLYEYDSRGNQTKVTYPDGDVWLYEYDSRGNNTKETSPDGDVWLYKYDERNNRTEVTYPDGRVTLYEYDYAPDGSLREMRENGERIVWFE